MGEPSICLICGKAHDGAIRGGKVTRLTSCFRSQRKERRRERETAGAIIRRSNLRNLITPAEPMLCRCGAFLTVTHQMHCPMWRAMQDAAAKGARIVAGRDWDDDAADEVSL